MLAIEMPHLTVTIEMPPEAVGMPDPGDELVERVIGWPSREFFYWSGRRSVHELERTLGNTDRTLDSFESILDFGCGCGRIELWLADLGQKRTLHATDIDPEAIEWAQANIPHVSFSVNSPDPPLPFDVGTFDLVFNHSVFTHIDAGRQDQWLSELHRVTRPGGLVVLTVHGVHYAFQDQWAKFRSQLEAEGIVHLADVLPRGGPFPEWYQSTLHAPWYIFEHWGRWFDIRALITGGSLGHDHVLLERTTDALPRDTLRGRPPHVVASSPPREPAAPGPEIRAALDRVLRVHAEAAAFPSRFGRAGKIARGAVLRLMRPYTTHEARIDGALVDAIDQLARLVNEHTDRIDAIDGARPFTGA